MNARNRHLDPTATRSDFAARPRTAPSLPMAAKTALTALAAGVLIFTPAPAHAQFGPQISRWGFYADSIHADIMARPVWRGRLLAGDMLITGGFDASIFGHALIAYGDWGLAAGIRTFGVLGESDVGLRGVTGRISADAELYRLLGSDGARIGLTASPYFAWGDDVAAELGLGIYELPIPWLPEVPPRLDFEVLHDFGAFDGTLIHAALRQMVGLGPIFIPMALQAWADDYAGGSFDYTAWQVALGVGFEPGASRRGAAPGNDPDAGALRLRLLLFRLDREGPDAHYGAELHVAWIM